MSIQQKALQIIGHVHTKRMSHKTTRDTSCDCIDVFVSYGFDFYVIPCVVKCTCYVEEPAHVFGEGGLFRSELFLCLVTDQFHNMFISISLFIEPQTYLLHKSQFLCETL